MDGLGFTLLEILVVLAVLAMLASLTWPSVRRMFDKRELLGAAQEVRAALAKTRLRAIESGVSRQFRWQVGDSHYSMARCGGPEDAQQGARGSRVPSDLLPGDSIEATLAAGLYFGDPAETRARAPSSRPPSSLPLPHGIAPAAGGRAHAPVSRSPAAERTAQSQSIVFQANGKTCNARITIFGAEGRYVRVDLRGLTGLAKVGRVERAEQEP